MKNNKNIKEAFDKLHIALVETLNTATKIEYFSMVETNRYVEQIDSIDRQLKDLRFFIHSRTVGG